MMIPRQQFTFTPPLVFDPRNPYAPLQPWFDPALDMRSLEPPVVYGVGQGLEVKYPDCPVDHYGLVFQIVNGQVYVLHNSKSKGNGLVLETLNEFARGQEVRIVARPASTEHLHGILDRARWAIAVGWVYVLRTQNCEHFVNFCYSGVKVSPTVEKVEALELLALVVAGVWGVSVVAETWKS